MSIEKGTVLNGRYRIRRLLGSGGMAHVYLAEDMRNGKSVAIKVLKRELNDDPEFVRRFETEARAASSLSYENIVKVLGVGEANGYRYMVQEYVDGISLKDMIRHYGRLDWRIAVPMFIQIAMALANAHDGGIIHRDIKPHNIMITRDHKAMVTDFGIARATTSNTITQTGSSTLGSVHYFSPEQARGGQVSAKSDIYSLGVLMYETLTGILPFDGDTSVSIAIKHLQETPEAPNVLEPTIPQGLSDIVMRCLRKNPSERYQDARDLVRELDAFMINPQGVYGIGRQQDAFETSNGAAYIEMDEPGNSYEKVRDFEQAVMSRRSSRRRESGAVVAIVLLSIALVVGGVIFFVDRIREEIKPPVQEEQPVEMANFVGQNYDVIKPVLDEYGIKYQVTKEENSEAAAGVILWQSVSEGEKYYPGKDDPLLLKVSAEAKLKQSYLGDFRGKQAQAVESLLKEEGMNVQVLPEENETDYAPGLITRHEPSVNALVSEGDTITLYVAQKPDYLTVPPVWALSEEDAVQALKDAGFTIQSIVIPEGDIAPYYGRWVEDLEQKVLQPGTTVPSNQQVKLIVGDYNRMFGSEDTEPPTEQGGGEGGEDQTGGIEPDAPQPITPVEG